LEEKIILQRPHAGSALAQVNPRVRTQLAQSQ
jgi:hypothetical protein